MKKTLLLCSVLFFSLTLETQAQFTIQTSYLLGLPQGEMSLNIRQSHTASALFLYNMPETPFSFGVELGYGGYGSETTAQQYQLTNGDEITADVNVFNAITQLQAVAQLELTPPGTRLAPYVQGKIGWHIYGTTLTIEDPREAYTSDCPKPLETNLLSRDAVFIGNVGLGMRYNFINIENFDGSPFQVYLDFNIGYNFGATASYMSVNPPSQGQTNTGENVNIEFASEAQPDVITEYNVGKLYTTPIEFIEMRFGFGISF